MVLKPRVRLRIFWIAAIVFFTFVMGIVFVPQMMTLNNMKPRIQAAIATRTGITAQINGDVHFSLLGRATIVAHDIRVPGGHIGSAVFAVPISALFDLDNAALSGPITIENAVFDVSNLAAPARDYTVNIDNCAVNFLGKRYDIVRGEINPSGFRGVIRTDQHKYTLESQNGNFHIKNHSNELNIIGRLYSDGGATGSMTIRTNNINRWFDFSEPKISGPVSLAMRFEWDGEYGFNFTDIQTENIRGDIKLYPSGARRINLASRNLDFDFSFLLDPTRVFYETDFNLDFYGRLKFANHVFRHVFVNARGTKSNLEIGKIIADDYVLAGGTVDAAGAHNVHVTMPINNVSTSCLFSGTPTKWQCTQFTYGNISGDISVDNGDVIAHVWSNEKMPATTEFEIIRKLGRAGRVDFQFADAGGVMDIRTGDIRWSYVAARKLSDIGLDMPFLPAFMRDSVVSMVSSDGQYIFTPHNAGWKIIITNNHFEIAGTSFKSWIPQIDSRAIRDTAYIISGNYSGGAVSDLTLVAGENTFHGSANKNTITLSADVFNLDAMLNPEFFDNYEELEFLVPDPLTVPFDLGFNVSLTAQTLVYNGTAFANFVYSLKNKTQTFSIADSDMGNILAQIVKNKSKYDISIQMNRFLLAGALLRANSGVNVRDTMITGDIEMTTSGRISHDIWHNLTGNIDLTLDGGYLVGIGLDEFYANAARINTLNAEFLLARALESGESQIKSIRLIGRYANGVFETTSPMLLSLRHVDAAGELRASSDGVEMQMNMILRGTSPQPAPIALSILQNGIRKYSLEQIMSDFDPEFMRAFTTSHSQF